MQLHINEVTGANWRQIVELSVSEQQELFIESNALSLAESQYEPGWHSVGLYDNELLVGYAMYGYASLKNNTVWLDRFMIDHRYQGKGYAKAFGKLLIQRMITEYNCKIIYLSLHPDNKQAQTLYEQLGFRLNGEIDDEGLVTGVVMELKVK